MSNQIDDLFKKKLEAHSIEPDPNVWSKISSGFLKKNKAIIWFRAAAALLLMVSAFWLYHNINGNDNTPTKITEVHPTELKEEKPAVIQEKVIEEKNNTTKASVPTIQKPKLLADKNNNESHDKMVEEGNPAINIPIKQVAPIAQIDIIDIDPAEGNPVNEEAVSKPISKPIVIVYELKSYTEKTESDSEFDPFPQKKNGLKKVLDVANNIRTGESPLSGLRQVKEELFALNFKKEDKHNK